MREKVLVIDDEQEICNLLKDFLSHEGYEVATATSSEEGIQKLDLEKPKVVLLDIRMPGTNGIETLKKIRECAPGVGILMATAVMDEDVAREAVNLGASDYIVKPFDLDYLKKCLLVKIASLT